MARTPLFDMLQRALRDEAHADHQAGHDNRRDGMIGRRALLRGTAGFAATTLLPAVGLAATARIAVVGAGLAGLTAAYRLAIAGYDVKVFEASGRVGGRCYSARNAFGNGQTAERGGEFIDTGHGAIRRLVTELGLKLDDVLNPPSNETEFYFVGGNDYSLKTATSEWKSFYKALKQQLADVGRETSYRRSTPKAREYDAMTISEWVRQFVPGGRRSQLGELIEAAFAEENGADADQQSALNLIQTLGGDAEDNFNLYYNSSDQRFHVRGGNDQIPERLSQHEKMKGRIETGTALVALRSQPPENKVTLSLRRGAATVDEVYDRVILALPFSVMRSFVDYKRAGFRPLKNRAIETMPIGVNTKFQLEFEKRRWSELGCNGEIRVPSSTFQTTWEVTRRQPGQTGILNFFSGGTCAVNAGRMENRALAATVLKEASLVLHDLESFWTKRMIKDAWQDNPWALGSYSYFPPRYLTEVSGVEAEREGSCFFAGEHTADEPAFLNSGVETGERAAKEVVDSL